MSSLRKWLGELHKHQKDILLVYHPEEDSTWSDRALYLDELCDYSHTKPYNHRVILEQEVVLEYDEGEPEFNRKCADWVTTRLREDNIKYAKWSSGNKSTHVHVLLDFKQASNNKLLKRIFMRHYGTIYVCPETGRFYSEDTKPEKLGREHRVLPDLQLDGQGHLIRAEYGVHEKTGRKKSLVSRSPGYPEVSVIPPIVWTKYSSAYRTVLRRQTTRSVGDLMDHPGVQLILDGTSMRELGDGRTRALYHLITILKNKYAKPEELTSFLQSWYKYCNGNSLTNSQIKYHVHYNYSKGYSFSPERFNDFLEEIGREDLILE